MPQPRVIWGYGDALCHQGLHRCPPLKRVEVVEGEGAAAVNVAVMLMAPVTVTVQSPVPEHPAPLQPVKVEPMAEKAVRVTLVPSGKLALQVMPQVIPPGREPTVPTPVPLLVTVRVLVVGKGVEPPSGVVISA
jgi:hypothetical protein